MLDIAGRSEVVSLDRLKPAYSGTQPQVYKRVRGAREYTARDLRAHAYCTRVQFARHASKKGVSHAACTSNVACASDIASAS